MRTYEALYIVSPDLEDSAIQTIVADVERLITGNGGTIVRSDVWGKRKLAYTIKKHVEGVYVVLRFEANPDFIKRFEQQMRLMESVIRYMVLHLDAQTLKLEAEQQRQYEEALRASAARRSQGEGDDDDDDEGDERIPTRKRIDVDAIDDDLEESGEDDEGDDGDDDDDE
ncbi:MAG TPA: 30S ribosomal protein S6 [Candidatus Hydrogenedentes bacterium]|nr:30S ribosomal protein S6 [Candidatus Hydrogenedentota bacterium]